MDPRHHDQIAKWERRWIAASGLLMLGFIVLIAYSLATEGAHIAQTTARGTPQSLLQQPLFSEPGLRVTGPGQVQVSLVAQAFSWMPETVRVPVGAEVEFYLTARDVIHGWQVERTNLNVEVIPGEVSRLRYTFTQPGTYRVTCNEYCGIGHQNMMGWIEVLPASQWAAALQETAAAEAQAGPPSLAAIGAEVYGRNCASCHGAAGAGLPGAFPPLAGHAAELAALDGGQELLIDTLLYGLQGPIQVAGANYAGVMPAWQQLSDEQIAGVLEHLLLLGAPEAPGEPAFSPEMVAERRDRGLSPDQVHTFRQEVVGR